MLDLVELALELKEQTEWQETPMPLTNSAYVRMVIRALQRLFVDTGRAKEYDSTKLQYSVSEYETTCTYDAVFPLDEIMYIKYCAQIEFFRKVQSDVNNTFGYTTNALSVTNADKPYANLKDTLFNLDNERRIIYYKMVPYTLGEG